MCISKSNGNAQSDNVVEKNAPNRVSKHIYICWQVPWESLTYEYMIYLIMFMINTPVYICSPYIIYMKMYLCWIYVLCNYIIYNLPTCQVSYYGPHSKSLILSQSDCVDAEMEEQPGKHLLI